MKYRILVVDDDVKNLKSTRMLLEEFGYLVETAENAAEALTLASQSYAAILIDYRMPDLSGAELAIELAKINSSAVRIMYSCDESRTALKHSMRAGVTDFVDKDSDPKVLLDTLARACISFSQNTAGAVPDAGYLENRRLLASIGMVGQAHVMADVAKKCLRYRETRDVIAILGETGVGKELIARAAHNGPESTLFPLNCAGFSDGDVTEGELFGYEKGTFTGAVGRKIGIFERAGSGTVFLDEVEKLPFRTQGALLRVLREGKIRRKGGDIEIEVSCRIIAAGKPNLKELVDQGSFLPDLYYRLNFLMIEIPPLRDRPEDIPLLVQEFCDRHLEKTGIRKIVSSSALNALLSYKWPGNVGELAGCITRALYDSASGTIELRDLDPRFASRQDAVYRTFNTLPELLERHDLEKRTLVERALRESSSQRQAALKIGTTESRLRRMLGQEKDSSREKVSG